MGIPCAPEKNDYIGASEFKMNFPYPERIILKQCRSAHSDPIVGSAAK